MITRLARRLRPITIIWITLLWCLLMGEVTAANLIGGALVGAAIMLILPLPKIPAVGHPVRLGALAAFLVRWTVELFHASFSVAYLALRRADPPRSAIIHAPMRVSSELVLAFATGLYNLQPGGSVSDIDIANRKWTVHLLNAHDDQAIADELAKIRQLEADMISIFERG